MAIWALFAGAAIALQASMNAQLGSLLKNSWLGTGIAFFASLLFCIPFILGFTKQLPSAIELKAVPWYLWFSGGALSAFGVGIFYFLIPKMGVGSMMSFALSGQIVVAMLASHFGWFNMPLIPITWIKAVGVCLLILSIILINWGSQNGY